MSDQLTRDAIAARNAGMSYGKYMAMKEHRDPMTDEPLPGERKIICEKCGKPFFRSDKKIVKYCRECREGRTLYKKSCPVCGKEFTCKNSHRRYCSDDCKHSNDGRKARERMAAERSANICNCAKCGAPFVPFHRAKYCSEECRVKVAAERSHKQWENRMAKRLEISRDEIEFDYGAED